MPIVNGRYVSPTWLNNAPPAIDQTELQAITDTLAELDSGSGGGSGKRYANFVIGTSTNGWTTDDCDYLCDGIADNVEIQAAINALPSSGGEIKFLTGTYVISSMLSLQQASSFSLLLSGSGDSTILNFFSIGDAGISCSNGQTLKLFNFGFSFFKGFVAVASSTIISEMCSYTNCSLGSIFCNSILRSNRFYVTQNISGNYLMNLTPTSTGGFSICTSNSFSYSTGITSPTTVVAAGGLSEISDNTFYCNGGTAISSGNNCTIIGNSVYKANISAAFNSSISGNFVSGGSILGIQSSISGNSVVAGTITGNEGSSICGNNIYQSDPIGDSCIHISKSRNNESETAFTVISGNTCNGGNVGIFLDTNSFSYKAQSHAVITGNACSSSVPLQIESNWSNCLITGNMFPNGAIVDNGSGNTKANNVTGT